MIVSAAVKIKDLRQNKEIIIPCHRHCDCFYILKQFAYKKDIDYKEIAQGFLDEKDNFYTRVEAWNEAYRCNQLMVVDNTSKELFSEDLY